MLLVDPWGLWQGTAEITAPPRGLEARARDSVSTAIGNIVNDPHPGARADTVMNIAGTITTTGTISTAAAWKYGLQYSPIIGTFLGKAAYDYWGTGQPGWFAAKDIAQGWLEDLKDWWSDPCETN